jgi:hypothetical protein
VSDSNVFRGEEENAAAPHFPPLPVLACNPVAERSRGHFLITGKEADIQIIKFRTSNVE